MDPFNLTNNCTTNTAKQIWDAYIAKYKEKDCIFQFTFFIHLVTTKVGEFKYITKYNTDFQITIDKLSSSRENLPTDPKVAVYLNEIEDKYSDFAAANKSAAYIKSQKSLQSLQN